MLTTADDGFNPMKFLEVAIKLAENGDEANLRTAVGRAYYAVFLVTRDKLGIKATEDSHKKVLEALHKRNHITLKDQLKAVRDLRTVADYEMIPENENCRNWETNWIRQKAFIDKLLPQVNAL